MLAISCLMAYTRPVTALVEKKNAIRKKFRANANFQSHKWNGLQSSTCRHLLLC